MSDAGNQELARQAGDEDKLILNGVSLEVPKGQVHAIMGPNGSGKSTLAHALAARDGYEVTAGEVLWNGDNLLEMEPDERGRPGVFLAFQYPMEIPASRRLPSCGRRSTRCAASAGRRS